ncbi:hypothetical protein, partial [Klebsiella pneumoniae]|uniref:hypothetical protein n=1 Tax=Klebsiella pneumoniae TaxID=573 RepID=UPI0025A0FBA3
HLFLVFSARFSPEERCHGGLLAVVPCLWRRIIGIISEVKWGNAKKVFNRLFFQQCGEECRKKPPFCRFNRRNGAPGGILLE